MRAALLSVSARGGLRAHIMCVSFLTKLLQIWISNRATSVCMEYGVQCRLCLLQTMAALVVSITHEKIFKEVCFIWPLWFNSSSHIIFLLSSSLGYILNLFNTLVHVLSTFNCAFTQRLNVVATWPICNCPVVHQLRRESGKVWGFRKTTGASAAGRVGNKGGALVQEMDWCRLAAKPFLGSMMSNTLTSIWGSQWVYGRVVSKSLGKMFAPPP